MEFVCKSDDPSFFCNQQKTPPEDRRGFLLVKQSLVKVIRRDRP